MRYRCVLSEIAEACRSLRYTPSYGRKFIRKTTVYYSCSMVEQLFRYSTSAPRGKCLMSKRLDVARYGCALLKRARRKRMERQEGTLTRQQKSCDRSRSLLCANSADTVFKLPTTITAHGGCDYLPTSSPCLPPRDVTDSFKLLKYLTPTHVCELHRYCRFFSSSEQTSSRQVIMPPGTPDNGFIVPYPIRVDDFANPPGTRHAVLFMLSHTHSDHIVGLSAKSFSGKIVCSRDAKAMLLLHESYKGRRLKDHELRGEEGSARTFGHLSIKPANVGGRVNYSGCRDLLVRGELFVAFVPLNLGIDNGKVGLTD
jgi:hypothetical protein